MTQDSAAKHRINRPRTKKPPKRITEHYLYNAGLNYLQRFTAGTGHFRTVMTRKIDRSCRHHTDQDRNACLKLLEELITRLTANGLLNDEAYTRGMVNSLRRRGLSARAIESRLQQKGIGTENARRALEQYDAEEHSEDTELESALIFIRRKRLGPFATTEKKAAPDKAIAALARAGFSCDIARRILKTEQE